jgi:hypothetical protein
MRSTPLVQAPAPQNVSTSVARLPAPAITALRGCSDRPTVLATWMTSTSSSSTAPAASARTKPSPKKAPLSAAKGCAEVASRSS